MPSHILPFQTVGSRDFGKILTTCRQFCLPGKIIRSPQCESLTSTFGSRFLIPYILCKSIRGGEIFFFFLSLHIITYTRRSLPRSIPVWNVNENLILVLYHFDRMFTSCITPEKNYFLFALNQNKIYRPSRVIFSQKS